MTMATASSRKQRTHTIKRIITKHTTNSIKSILNSSTLEMVTMTSRTLISLREFYSLFTYYSGYYNADANNPYQQEGGYYEGHQQGDQDEYYNDQYYDQGAPAAGQQPQYGQGGYAFVLISFVNRYSN